MSTDVKSSAIGGALSPERSQTDSAPLLETDRLRLRAHVVKDYPVFMAIWSDPEVYRHIGGQPSTPEAAWMRMLLYAGLWRMLAYGYWAIEEKSTGRCVGDIGYADFHRDITPSLDGMPELGWVLASEVHGRGYAIEALNAVLAWGEARFGEHQASCIITPDNTASIRLANKAGFSFSHESTFRERIVHIFIR